MRNYYRSAHAANANCNITQDASHWLMYEAYIASHVTTFPFLQPLLTAVQQKDVGETLKVASAIGDPTLLHGGHMPLKEARVRRQVDVFLKKFPFSRSEYDVDRTAVALSKMLAAEDQCAVTNKKLDWRTTALLPPFILRARRLIAKALGELQPQSIMKMISMGTHGPGATTASKGNRVTPYYKFMDLPYTCTEAARSYAYAAISSDPHWMEILEQSGRRKFIPLPGTPLYQQQLQLLNECVEIVEPDKVTFVPKDCRTDRPIAVGNSLNMYLQLGVCDYLVAKLKQVGVDLSDQQRNADMAGLGSKLAWIGDMVNPSSFATIDLASASDTISIGIVKTLLPPEWFAFLDDLRHKTGSVDGKEILYEKFSAMGCGFTFPLESLIFWAIAKAAAQEAGFQCKRNDIAVYGDDIIVRAEAAPHVIDALKWAGFLVNTEKSFVTGSFKESCGSDYFNGNNVRPFYLKRNVESYVDIYFICNSIADRLRGAQHDSGLIAVYTAMLALIPRKHRTYRPMETNKEQGLQVPIQYMRQLGLAPWLSPDESQHLRVKQLLADQSGQCSNARPVLLQQPYAWAIRTTAREYSGRNSTKLYLWLRSSSVATHLPIWWDEDRHTVAVREATLAGKIARRKSTVDLVNLAPVHNWNGDWTERELTKHHCGGWHNLDRGTRSEWYS
nr:MAG: hypothetical protein 3 [Leviviridae sp.]